jgi:hypothetical protein
MYSAMNFKSGENAAIILFTPTTYDMLQIVVIIISLYIVCVLSRDS